MSTKQIIFQGRVITVPSDYVAPPTPYQQLQTNMPQIKAQVPQDARITNVVPTKEGYDIQYVTPQRTVEPLEPWFGKGATPLESAEIVLSELTWRSQWDPIYKKKIEEKFRWTPQEKIVVEQTRRQQMEMAATAVSIASLAFVGTYGVAKVIQWRAPQLVEPILQSRLAQRFFYTKELVTTKELVDVPDEDSFSVLVKTKEGWIRKTLTPTYEGAKEVNIGKPLAPTEWAESTLWKDSGTVHTPYARTFESLISGGTQLTQQITRQATRQVTPTLTMVTKPTSLTSLAKSIGISVAPTIALTTATKSVASIKTVPFLVKYSGPKILPTYAMKQGKEIIARTKPSFKPYPPEQKFRLPQYPTDETIQKAMQPQMSKQKTAQTQRQFEKQLEKQAQQFRQTQKQTTTQTQILRQFQTQKQENLSRMFQIPRFGGGERARQPLKDRLGRWFFKRHPVTTVEQQLGLSKPRRRKRRGKR